MNPGKVSIVLGLRSRGLRWFRPRLGATAIKTMHQSIKFCNLQSTQAKR
jgi:hypothetical protein